MGEFKIEPQPLNIEQIPVGGERLNNVKRLVTGDKSLRFEKGALIITDENGVDRVLIGYLEGKF